MRIAIVGMLDEREEALLLLKQRIEERGHGTILIDTSMGVGNITPSLVPEITPQELAKKAGIDPDELPELVKSRRDMATSAISRGLSETLMSLQCKGEIKGVVAMGGMTTTTIALPAMKRLPFGFPKLMVSSALAMPAYSGRFSEFLGVKDIAVLHTVIDTVGMNALVESLVRSACGIICGMVEAFEPILTDQRPAIAMTELGFCDKGAQMIRALLSGRGYDVISFHATGSGDRAAEELVAQGIFKLFVDLVPAGLSEHLLGGNRDAGPERLKGAVRSGTPYLLAPCGFDMLSCGPIERKDKGDPLWVSRGLAQRKFLVQDAMRVQARTTAEEMQLIARAVAERLNRHPKKELVRFLIPRKGFSSLSTEGGPLHDPLADEVFVRTLRENLSAEIRILEVDAHINELAFAEAVERSVMELLGNACS